MTSSASSSSSSSASAPSTFQFESLSRPPSSVLEDGRFVYLPPLNSSTFFRRSVAKFNLINAEGSSPNDDDCDIEHTDIEHQRQQDGSNGSSNTDASTINTNTNIHPIQMASAKIHTHGISELSKHINLSSLIQSNEYFGLTSVIDKTAVVKTASTPTTAAASGGGGGGSSSSATAVTDQSASTAIGNTSSSSNDGTNTTNESKKQSNNNHHHDKEKGNSNVLLSSTKDATTTTNTAIIEQQDQQEQDQSIQKEQNIRSQYILKRKQIQYHSSYAKLTSHHKKLKVVTTMQHTIDRRLLELRRRWRLHVPNHGIHVAYPIQPTDEIAVDVDIYSDLNHYDVNNILGRGTCSTGSALSSSSVLGRIARTVPRFATIELSNDYDIHQQLKLYHNKHQYHHHKHHHHHEHDHSNIQKEASTTSTSNTIAQPFIAESSSLSSSSWNDLKRNIPMLTLVFQIEKSSTGYIQKVSLSSNIEDNHRNDKEDEFSTKTTPNKNKDDDDNIQNITKSIIESKTKLQNDELFIQSLQHSLFCANIFDIIRKEVINEQQQIGQDNTGLGAGIGGTNSTNNNRMKKATSTPNNTTTTNSTKQIAWLSSEMENSFLPAPSLMAGYNTTTTNTLDDENNNDILVSYNYLKSLPPLAVIHCHEGEVKVQLDSEYSLTVTLIDLNNDNDMNNDEEQEEEEVDKNNQGCNNLKSSGSQSPEQLQVLCRLLLLQAQLVYHESRKEQNRKINVELESLNKENFDENSATISVIDYSAGMKKKGSSSMGGGGGGGHLLKQQRNQRLLELSMTTPRILQSCVGLGKKFILERKIRKTLKHLLLWQKRRNSTVSNDNKHNVLQVEWLPSSLFETSSHFALSLSSNRVLDVKILGNEIVVSHVGDNGDYKSVNLSTSEEFELFLKNQCLHLEKKNNNF